jgi:hypothetical protein
MDPRGTAMTRTRYAHFAVSLAAALLAVTATACSTSEPCEVPDSPSLSVVSARGSGAITGLTVTYANELEGLNETVACGNQAGTTVCSWPEPTPTGSYELQIEAPGFQTAMVTTVLSAVPPAAANDCTTTQFTPSKFVLSPD